MSSVDRFVSVFKIPESPMDYGLSYLFNPVSLNEDKSKGVNRLTGEAQLVF